MNLQLFKNSFLQTFTCYFLIAIMFFIKFIRHDLILSMFLLKKRFPRNFLGTNHFPSERNYIVILNRSLKLLWKTWKYWNKFWGHYLLFRNWLNNAELARKNARVEHCVCLVQGALKFRCFLSGFPPVTTLIFPCGAVVHLR